MYIEEISLEQFSSEITNLSSSEFCVDFNSLLHNCAASPIHVHYKTDKIIVMTTYPERICLLSGKSRVNISQIKKIEKAKNGAKYIYMVTCGNIDEFRTTITMQQN